MHATTGVPNSGNARHPIGCASIHIFQYNLESPRHELIIGVEPTTDGCVRTLKAFENCIVHAPVRFGYDLDPRVLCSKALRNFNRAVVRITIHDDIFPSLTTLFQNAVYGFREVLSSVSNRCYHTNYRVTQVIPLT